MLRPAASAAPRSRRATVSRGRTTRWRRCARDPEVDLVVVALPEPPAPRGRARRCRGRQGRPVHEAARSERGRSRRDAPARSRRPAFPRATSRTRSSRRSHEGPGDGRLGRTSGGCSRSAAREGHSGPHAAALLGCRDGRRRGVPRHGLPLHRGVPATSSARTCRSATSSRGARRWATATRRPARTTRSMILRFEDGRAATIESSWTREGRHRGPQRGLRRAAAASSRTSTSTPIRAFIEQPAGYLAEKTDADTGWVFPSRTSRASHGYDELFRHFVGAFAAGVDAARDVRGRPRRQHASSMPRIARCGAAAGNRVGASVAMAGR